MSHSLFSMPPLIQWKQSTGLKEWHCASIAKRRCYGSEPVMGFSKQIWLIHKRYLTAYWSSCISQCSRWILHLHFCWCSHQRCSWFFYRCSRCHSCWFFVLGNIDMMLWLDKEFIACSSGGFVWEIFCDIRCWDGTEYFSDSDGDWQSDRTESLVCWKIRNNLREKTEDINFLVYVSSWKWKESAALNT